MTGFLRRRSLSRRTFLRGAGATVALPWLDAMVPPLARFVPPRRCMFVFSPNGKVMEDWRPEQRGRAYTMPFLLEPLEPLRERLLVATGLDLDGGFSHGDGPGDHARASASFLTTAHPFKTDGANVRNGVSVEDLDLLARTIAHRGGWPLFGRFVRAAQFVVVASSGGHRPGAALFRRLGHKRTRLAPASVKLSAGTVLDAARYSLRLNCVVTIIVVG